MPGSTEVKSHDSKFGQSDAKSMQFFALLSFADKYTQQLFSCLIDVGIGVGIRVGIGVGVFD